MDNNLGIDVDLINLDNLIDFKEEQKIVKNISKNIKKIKADPSRKARGA